MNERIVLEVLAIVCVVLVPILMLKSHECAHWKSQYESLRNETLAQGQRETTRIIYRLQTLDEHIDAQG